MGAGKEGYTNLWSTLKGWELEEKGTQNKFVYPSLPAPIPLMYSTSLCTLLLHLPSL
jgi:hypothetical protein